MHNGLRELLAILQRMDSAVVAFSGGVDSTLLLKVARSAISDKVIAVTSASATIASEDLAFAKQMASFIGVEHHLVETEEIHDSRFTSNPPNRCYYCKSRLFDKLSAFAKTQGTLFILDGSNAEDLGDFRPGQKAALEAGVRSPLLEAGLGKAEIKADVRQYRVPALISS